MAWKAAADTIAHEAVLVQKLSLFSCGVTILTSPVILFLDTSATPLGPKAGIAATLCAFGAFTTGELICMYSLLQHMHCDDVVILL